MNDKRIVSLILFVFLLIYVSSLILLERNYLFFTVVIIFSLTLMILVKLNREITIPIFLKIILFLIFLMIYFFIERIILNIYLFGIDNIGFLKHSGIIDKDHVMTMLDFKIWSFIFTLYYPIYIFIFIKPFVNHLDKSIRKIKDKDAHQ